MLWRALEKSGYYLVGSYVIFAIVGSAYIVWTTATMPYNLQSMGLASYSDMNKALFLYTLLTAVLLLFLWAYTGVLFVGKRVRTRRFFVGFPVLWWIFEVSIGGRIINSLLREEELESFELVSTLVDDYAKEFWWYTLFVWSFTLLQVVCIIYLLFSKRAKEIFIR